MPKIFKWLFVIIVTLLCIFGFYLGFLLLDMLGNTLAFLLIFGTVNLVFFASDNPSLALDYLVKLLMLTFIIGSIIFIYKKYKLAKWNKTLDFHMESKEYDTVFLILAKKLKSLDRNRKKYCHTKIDSTIKTKFFNLTKFPLDSLYYYSQRLYIYSPQKYDYLQRKVRKEKSLNEFGFGFFKEGIFFSLERPRPNSNKLYRVCKSLKFNELVQAELFKDKLKIHLSRNGQKIIVEIFKGETSISLKKLKKFLDILIEHKITQI